MPSENASILKLRSGRKETNKKIKKRQLVKTSFLFSNFLVFINSAGIILYYMKLLLSLFAAQCSFYISVNRIILATVGMFLFDCCLHLMKLSCSSRVGSFPQDGSYKAGWRIDHTGGAQALVSSASRHGGSHPPPQVSSASSYKFVESKNFSFDQENEI